jgi:hypothetical protein
MIWRWLTEVAASQSVRPAHLTCRFNFDGSEIAPEIDVIAVSAGDRPWTFVKRALSTPEKLHPDQSYKTGKCASAYPAASQARQGVDPPSIVSAKAEDLP